MVRQVVQESIRTVSMLMMIPADTIESVPVIRRFLMRADTTDGQRVFRRIQHDLRDTIVEGDRLAMLVTDNMGVIEFCNDEAAHMFGYVPVDLIGLHISKVISEPFMYSADDFAECVVLVAGFDSMAYGVRV
jgi:PAS domain-containing protein